MRLSVRILLMSIATAATFACQRCGPAPTPPGFFALDAGVSSSRRDAGAVEANNVAAFMASLPRTDAGKPIVIQMDTFFAPGMAMALVYDEALNDPVSRWGDCMQELIGCYRQDGPLDPCVRQIPRCGSAEGVGACCPAACHDAYTSELSAGMDEDTAISRSFRRGACVPGFLEQRNAWRQDGGAP